MSERAALLDEILKAAASAEVIIHFERREGSFRVWPWGADEKPFSVAIVDPETGEVSNHA